MTPLPQHSPIVTDLGHNLSTNQQPSRRPNTRMFILTIGPSRKNKKQKTKNLLGWAWWHRTIIPAIQKAEVEGSKAQGLSGLQMEFRASLDILVSFHLKMNVERGWKCLLSDSMLA